MYTKAEILQSKIIEQFERTLNKIWNLPCP